MGDAKPAPPAHAEPEVDDEEREEHERNAKKNPDYARQLAIAKQVRARPWVGA